MRRRGMRNRGGGGFGKAVDKNLYALTSFNAAAYFATQANGGEAGVATGWGAIEVIRVNKLGAAASRHTLNRGNGSVTNGWLLYVSTANALSFVVANGSAAAISSPAYTLTASDVGRILVVIGWRDVATGKIRLLVSRQQVADGTAITGYTPLSAQPTNLSGIASGPTVGAATDIDLLSSSTFRGDVTEAALQAVCDTVRANGDVPASIAGVTVAHRWSARDALLGVSNPAGRKSYGARAFTSAISLSTANPGGMAGQAAGFRVALLLRFDALTSANQSIIARTNNSNAGFQVAIPANNQLTFYAVSGAGSFVSAAYQLAAKDIGPYLRHVECVHTGTALQIWIDGAKVAGDVAITGYTPFAGPTILGQFGAAQPLTGVSLFGAGIAHAVPTAQEIADSATASITAGALRPIAGKTDRLWDLVGASTAGALPASVPDTMGSGDALTRTGSPELAVYTETAPPPPSALADTVTQASVDAMARVGLPRVTVIDPTIDGRATKGVLGFAENAYLEGTVAPLGSTTGMWISWYGVVDASLASARVINGNRESAVQRGFGLGMTSGNAPFFELATTSAIPGAIGTAFAAGDYGQPTVFHGLFTGSVARVYRDGMQQGADVAVAGTFVQALSKWRIGRMSDSLLVASSIRAFGEAGGNGVPTLAQIQAHAKAVLAGGRMVAMEGATTGLLHDFTQDTLDNGGELPVTCQDRAGSCHLARVDIDTPKVGPGGVRGVGPYAATDAWISAAGGGLQGALTFDVEVDLVLTKLPTAAAEVVACCSNAGVTTGWLLQIASSTSLRAVINGGTSAISSAYTITGADVGKRLRVVIRKTASVVQLWVNGVQAGADVAAAFYNANSGIAMQVGQLGSGVQPFVSGYVEAIQGGTGISVAEIATLSADLTQPMPSVSGTTKRNSFHLDTAATPAKTPRTSVERVSGASVDTLTRYGAGLQLAQRTERLWSYETTPVMKAGASSGSGANRWEGTASLACGGDTGGFYVGLLPRPRGTTASAKILANSNGGTQGWSISGASGTQLQCAMIDSGGTSRSSSLIVTANDSKVRAALFVYDAPGGMLRAYHNRALVGSTSMTGYATAGLSSIGLALGALFGGGSPQPDWDVLGVVYGLGVPTLAQFQAWEDACMAAEDVVAILGATHMYSPKSGLVGTTLKDLIGTYDLPAVGTPVVTDIYARAWAR